MEKWVKNEIIVLKKHYQYLPKHELIRVFNKINPNRTWIAIFKKANKIGLKKISYKKEVDGILRKKYSNTASKEILKNVRKYIPNISYEALKMRAKRLGLNRRTYYIQYQQCKQIKIPFPSKEFAWFLGVLAGDGHVRFSKEQLSYQISLSSISKSFTLNFNKIGEELFSIEPSYKIYKKYKLPNGIQRYYHVGVFNSKYMAEYLGDWKENVWHKTIITKFSWVLEKGGYISSFLEGFFDSDGTIRKNGARLSFAIQDRKTQKSVSYMLNKLEIRNSIYKNGVWINGRENSGKFAKLIKSSIPQKERRLMIAREYV